jgi:hypothetical protein
MPPIAGSFHGARNEYNEGKLMPANIQISRRSVLTGCAGATALAAAQSIDAAALRRRLEIPSAMQVEAVYAAPYLNDRSTSAGDGMEKSYQEILRLLEFLGRASDRYVFRGSSQFMKGPAAPVESAAAKDLIARAMKPRDKALYVLTLGAPTNVASAILMEPRIKDRIVVVWLGGTTREWPSARECNLQQDIHSSRVLFDSGVPLVRIPTKNVSEHLRTTMAEMEHFVKGKSRLCDYLFEQFVDYYKKATAKNPQPYTWSKVIWDISTVAWLIEPKWVPSQLRPSPILKDDFTWSLPPDRHPVRVATDIRRDPIFFDLFAKIAKV